MKSFFLDGLLLLLLEVLTAVNLPVVVVDLGDLRTTVRQFISFCTRVPFSDAKGLPQLVHQLLCQRVLLIAASQQVAHVDAKDGQKAWWIIINFFWS